MKKEENAPTPSVRALERGLQLLDYLIEIREGRLNHIAEVNGLPPSTAHRLLQALEQHGYVVSKVHGVYRLGVKGLWFTSLREPVRQILDELRRGSGETANFAMLVQDEMEYVERAVSDHALAFVVSVGTHIPLNCSALGKAVLAFRPGMLDCIKMERRTAHSITDTVELHADLEVARHRGFAIDNEEYFEGVYCLAVPVFDGEGAAVGGLSISGPTVRFAREQAFEQADLLKAAGERVTHLLSGRSENHCEALGPTISETPGGKKHGT